MINLNELNTFENMSELEADQVIGGSLFDTLSDLLDDLGDMGMDEEEEMDTPDPVVLPVNLRGLTRDFLSGLFFFS